MSRRTPEENTRDKIKQIIKDVLKREYIELSPKQVSAAEIFAEDKTMVYCEFSEKSGKKEKSLNMERRGHGAIDAVWRMLVEHYSKKYKSIIYKVKLNNKELNINLRIQRMKIKVNINCK